MNPFGRSQLWVALLCSANVTFGQPFGLTQRVANTTLAMPAFPPVYGYALTNAFPGLGFTDPTCLASPPGEPNRLFVLERAGLIQMINNLAAPTKSLYLNLAAGNSIVGEQGLCGLAFHPDFQSNGFFYVFRSIIVTNGSTVRTNERLSRFQATPPSAASASAGTELILIEQADDAPTHNSGDLHFGPDGYLYVSVGDEGLQQDVLNNSQTIRKDFFSGILRLDVDKKPGNLPPSPHPAIVPPTNYFVPADNPWVANSFNGTNNTGNVRTEFWAVGLRNPWRMSFDPVTGWLWCGDVGWDLREEVNVIVKGGNYGWAFREGTINGPKFNQTNLLGSPFIGVDPVYEIPHGNNGTNTGNAVIGGVVYRGNQIAQLNGAYVFCDYERGNVWSLRYDGTSVSQFQRLLVETGITCFGMDPRNGDVLMGDLDSDVIWRLVYNTNVSTGTPLPPTLANTGAFSNLALLQPAPGVVPYTLNVPFWSDNAIKSRWFSVPNTNLMIGFNPTSNWQFPTGSVWIKHFELVTNVDTGERKRLETRFIVRNSTGVYGVTYRWGSLTTNATLVPVDGLDEPLIINEGGVLRTQVWHYPSRGECLGCHSGSGGFALGFNTPQLNRDHSYANYTGVTDNQLRALDHVGYFNPPVTNLNGLIALAGATNTAASLEWRVRSYLAANCVQCHQPGGSGLAYWDARITTPTASAGLIDGPLVNDGGNGANRVIKPGSLVNSMLHTRISTPALRMPPLATSELDTNAIGLLSEWINSSALINYRTFEQWQVSYFGSIPSPDADPWSDSDGDGRGNYLEYLLGGNPLLADGSWNVDIRRMNDTVEIVFPRLANRGFEVQWAPDPDATSAWQILDVPGNQPFFPATTSEAVLQDTITNVTQKFYRVRVFAP